MTSRQKLYAMGETLGECVTRPKLGGGYVCGGGGGGGQTSSRNDTATNNTDQRVAVQDGIGLSGSSNNVVEYNSTDAVKAIAQLGADTIKATGEAVVQLNQTSTAANVTTWDKTLTTSAALVDKLIDSASASYGIAEKAIDRYQPAENKAQDTSLKLGMIAAAGVAAVVLLGKMK